MLLPKHGVTRTLKRHSTAIASGMGAAIAGVGLGAAIKGIQHDGIDYFDYGHGQTAHIPPVTTQVRTSENNLVKIQGLGVDASHSTTLIPAFAIPLGVFCMVCACMITRCWLCQCGRGETHQHMPTQ